MEIHKKHTKWSDEEIKKEALKYNTRSEFERENKRAYQVATRRNMMDMICQHMKPAFRYTFEMLQTEALKYNNKKDFSINSSGAHMVAIQRGILDQICSHMIRLHHEKYTKEELLIEALKYSEKVEFKKNNNSAYNSARKQRLIDQICAHMPKRKDKIGSNNPAFKWTDDLVIKEALKYTQRSEFHKYSPAAYDSARNRKVLEQVCNHMDKPNNTSKPEQMLFNIVKNIFLNTKKLKDRKVLIENKPYIQGFDIDIFIPELNKGIEFDGTYWHSFEKMRKSVFKSSWSDEDIHNYHEIKDNYFLSKGIKILHIKEEDWNTNKEECTKRCFEFLR